MVRVAVRAARPFRGTGPWAGTGACPYGGTGRAGSVGFTLVELMIALVLSGVVMASAYLVLRENQRFYRAQSEILDVQENVRYVADILPAELRELDASDGDIVAMSDTAITLKAMRGFGVLCAAPNVASAQIVLRNSLLFGFRAIDPARDSVLIFRDGDTGRRDDDRWLRAPVTQVASSGVTCADGAAGTRLTVTGLVGGTSQLDSVFQGAPVRTFEMVNYRLYADAEGKWWLGGRAVSAGSWTITSPIAGPLTSSGLTFRYYASDGAVTAVATNVAQVEVVVRGESQRPVHLGGRPPALYRDSLIGRAALRNNVRN